MIRFVLALCLLVVSANCFAQSPEIVQIPYPYNSVACIGLGDDGGTGTLIAVADGKGLILTVKHVARKRGRKCWARWGDIKTEGYVLALHPTRDAALLIVDAPPGITPAKYGPLDVKNGPFVSVGYPYYSRKFIHFRTHAYKYTHPEHLVLHGYSANGMSGGGVFDRNGTLIGTHWGSLPRDNESFVTAGPELDAFVAEYFQCSK